MRRRFRSLHAKNAGVLVLAIGGAIPYGFDAAGSVAVGGGIEVVNLLALERSVRLLVGSRLSAAGGSLVFTRTVLFMGAVFAVLAFAPVRPLWFAVGVLAAVPALIWHGLASPSKVQS